MKHGTTFSAILSKTALPAFLVALVLLHASRGFGRGRVANAAKQEFDWNHVSSEIERLRGEWNVPGTAVGIVHNSELVYAQGFGIRDQDGKKVDPDTLFQIASTTKAFTSFAVASLVDDGRLNWDSPLSSIFNVAFMDPTASSEATLIDILSHRTGLPRHDDMITMWAHEEDIVHRIRHLPPSQPFRSTFQYNNLMYVLAGTLAGNASQKGYEALVRERVLEPLGMDRTLIQPREIENVENHARGYLVHGDGSRSMYEYNETFWAESGKPAGSMASNVNDMAKWVSFINRRATTANGTSLLSSEQFDTIMSPHARATEIIFPTDGVITEPWYGLGWLLDTYRGTTRIHHTGHLPGYSTQVATFPTADVAIIVFANMGDTPFPAMLSCFLADMLLFPDVRTDWSRLWMDNVEQGQKEQEEVRRKGIASRKRGTKPTFPLIAYEGAFYNDAYGTITLTQSPNDTLHVQWIGTRTVDFGQLTHWENDVFGLVRVFAGFNERYEDLEWPLWKVWFEVAGGAVTSLRAGVQPTIDPILFRRF
ncbi:beta-lactamase/transpeptidase-like protein [Chytriomyces sp. MP71]|nr:beta-lactamase/transpeptidase-like protein [Chytriomyces sp. MP71]